jgi:uncharacterized damage-inducible protein DinB
MQRDDLLLFFDYNAWANQRVLAACRGLTSAQLHAPAQCSFGSLMGTLAHIYAAERAWRLRLQEGVSPGALPGGADFATLTALETAWAGETAALRAFVAGLDDAGLVCWVEYTTTSGGPQGSTLWRALVHVALHGTQFRAEAGAVLAALGRSPGDLDFILFLRETGQR